MENTPRFAFSSSVQQICDRNGAFDSGIVRIAYPGNNRNGSSISKDVFEKCFNTIYYVPIVCNYDRETDELGGHDVDFVHDSDGKLKMINATTPIGVIPENAEYWWENVDDESGTKEYICTNALLWKRQEAYDKVKKDGYADLSMEIMLNDFHMDDGIIIVDSFEFMALCLLGSDVEPCYESAGIKVFEANNFRTEYMQMVAELKGETQQVNASEEVDIKNTYSNKKGEDLMEKQKLELLAQYGLTAEELDFNIDDFTLEELEAKFAAQDANADDADGQEDPAAEDPDGGTPADFSLTGEQLTEGLREALDSVQFTDDWGYESRRYWYCDYDAEVNEVYCYDQADWKLYGFTYTINGDAITVDFDSKKKKKIAFIDFIDGDTEFSFSQIAEGFAEGRVAFKLDEQNTELTEKFNAELGEANKKIDSMEAELTELRKFQSDAFAAEREAQEEELFSAFADLDGVEAFENLRENCSDMTIEEIEEKCFALRGRFMQQNFSVKKTTGQTRLPIDKTRESVGDTYYGGFFEEFPPSNRY